MTLSSLTLAPLIPNSFRAGVVSKQSISRAQLVSTSVGRTWLGRIGRFIRRHLFESVSRSGSISKILSPKKTVLQH